MINNSGINNNYKDSGYNINTPNMNLQNKKQNIKKNPDDMISIKDMEAASEKKDNTFYNINNEKHWNIISEAKNLLKKIKALELNADTFSFSEEYKFAKSFKKLKQTIKNFIEKNKEKHIRNVQEELTEISSKDGGYLLDSYNDKGEFSNLGKVDDTRTYSGNTIEGSINIKG